MTGSGRELRRFIAAGRADGMVQMRAEQEWGWGAVYLESKDLLSQV